MFLLIPFLLSGLFLFLLVNCAFLFGSDDSSDDSDSEKKEKSGASKTNARAPPKPVASLKGPCKVAPSTSGSKAKRLKVDLKEQARQRLVASSSKKAGKLKRPKTKSNTKMKRPQPATAPLRPSTPSGDAVPLPKMARAASRTKKTYVNPGPIIPDLKISSCVKNELIIYNPYLLMGAQVPKNNGMILVDNASYQEAIEEAKATGMLVHSTKPEPKASLIATKCKPSSVVAQDTVTFIVPESNIAKTQLGPSQPPPSTRKSLAKSRQRASGRSASRKTMPICSSSRKSSTNRPPRQKSSALRPLTITAAKTSKTTAKRVVIAGKLLAATDNSKEAFFSTRSED